MKQDLAFLDALDARIAGAAKRGSGKIWISHYDRLRLTKLLPPTFPKPPSIRQGREKFISLNYISCATQAARAPIEARMLAQVTAKLAPEPTDEYLAEIQSASRYARALQMQQAQIQQAQAQSLNNRFRDQLKLLNTLKRLITP